MSYEYDTIADMSMLSFLAGARADCHNGAMVTLAAGEFVAYGPSHLTVLAVFTIGAGALVWIGRRQTEAQARTFGRCFALVIVAVFLVALAYKLVRFDIQNSIPLQLCDIAELIAAVALWFGARWAFGVTYFWGLLLSSQALLTPDIGTARDGAPDFPHHLFLTFFALHVLVVWAAVYLTWGRGMRPRWAEFRLAVLLALAWVALTLGFNSLAGTNYGYLNGKPPTSSVLDLLGPWPLYVVVEIVVVILVWAAMTWPWERAARLRPLRRGSESRPDRARS
ncbi:putative integral membrane protein [Mycolicibacterium tokaiense]|uniref:Putative integral membrane protein n=2 Tax=Mycolicibacterium tokaiense TaxID=39695 RepID=A0A378TMB6_9MYCO|nr:hypothetical protein MTOK_02710 [Mycolicibacterium tokaiense]STZ61003.1 putative integral membrane protein [Mycolicibacterium tokaiense]